MPASTAISEALDYDTVFFIPPHNLLSFFAALFGFLDFAKNNLACSAALDSIPVFSLPSKKIQEFSHLQNPPSSQHPFGYLQPAKPSIIYQLQHTVTHLPHAPRQHTVTPPAPRLAQQCLRFSAPKGKIAASISTLAWTQLHRATRDDQRRGRIIIPIWPFLLFWMLNSHTDTSPC